MNGLYAYVTPNDPGIIGDTDSQSIQRAIAAAKSSGCNTVLIPRICARTGLAVWNIDRAILLPSDITVLLDNCHLRLVDDVYQNIFRNENLFNPIGLTEAGEQHDIHIIGIGNAILDGGNPNDLREATSSKDGRPHVRLNNLILLHNVRDYSIENLSCLNMRWWAINQLFCRRGYLNRLYFWNGEKIPNQDGVNLRIGCHDITVENISGRTGDDTVALTALPLCSDKTLYVAGKSVDIHDVIVRNVRSHTEQTIVALRNQDGAKLYNITIENISDTGGIYHPWGVLRIGENNYFRERLSCLGETYNIRVRGVTSRTGGTVMLGATLANSHISDVCAGGSAYHAVSTFMIPAVSRETKNHFFGGITMENVTFDNIRYNAELPHGDTLNWRSDARFSYPTEIIDGVDYIAKFNAQPYYGAALDFRHMQPFHTLKNVVFRDIYAREGVERFVTEGLKPEGFRLDVRD